MIMKKILISVIFFGTFGMANGADWFEGWRTAESLSDAESTASMMVAGGAWAVSARPGANMAVRHLIAGESICSNADKVFAQPGHPQQVDGGLNCWCRMAIPLTGPWIFSNTHDEGMGCVANCAINCIYNVRDNAEFRRAIIGTR